MAYMDEKFLIHNTHLENSKTFAQTDPNLRRLEQQYYVYQSELIGQLPRKISGIYTLTGARQIGKTTLIKQFMLSLLQDNVNPQSIAFFSGELIKDQDDLLYILQEQLKIVPKGKIAFLFIDEVTYIKDWDKAVKYMADALQLENTILLLTGSDNILLKKMRMRLPGRRGKSSVVDFHLYPLSFREFVRLKNKIDLSNIEKNFQPDEKIYKYLMQEFENYLKHGGYLKAINDLALDHKILDATFQTYSHWIRGDILKEKKSENYLREIVTGIIKRYGSQITWNSLAKDLSIEHHQTISDYVELLESMDVLITQQALLEDKLLGAPKKARKIYFTDPFIYHALQAWLNNSQDIYDSQVLPILEDSIMCSRLVEACVVAHYHRFYHQVFYIKAEGEVDIAYVNQSKFWPVEIKWTEQLHAKDLKQVRKYNNAIILNKNNDFGEINGIKVIPLVWQLLHLK